MKTKTIVSTILLYIITLILLKFFSIISTGWLILLTVPFWFPILFFIIYILIIMIMLYFYNHLKTFINKSKN